jgi:hypothetical protein
MTSFYVESSVLKEDEPIAAEGNVVSCELNRGTVHKPEMKEWNAIAG